MTLRVLLTGQSNAYGADPNGGPLYSTCSPLLRMWNNSPPGVAPAYGNAWVTPPFLYNQNLGVWFSNAEAVELGMHVDYILCAEGGRPIADWQGAGKYMYDALKGVWQHAAAAPADVLLWHQGEADVTMSAGAYAAKFSSMISYLMTANILDRDAKILIGGLSEIIPAQATFNANVLVPIAAANPRMAYVPSAGLTTLADGYHFDGASLYAFGGRYYEAYMEIA